MNRLLLPLAAALLPLLWTQTASAHFLWLRVEDAADKKPAMIKVYFSEEAEPDSPKLLDRVTKAEVWAMGSGRGRRSQPTALTLKKGTDALEAELTSGQAGAPLVLRHTYGVTSRGGKTFLLKYHAKTYSTPLTGSWQAVKDADRLPLEITPKAEGDATVLNVTWKGKPVAGDEVVVVGPGLDDAVKLETDAEGACRCQLLEAGVYSIRVRHVEDAAGEHDGKAYQEIRHYSTLTLPYAPQRLNSVASKFPALPNGTTSFGGAVLGDTLYVYGGNYGSAHHYCNEDQSGDFLSLDLKNPKEWKSLPGGPKLQGLAMVAWQGNLYRVGGFTAMNKDGDPDDLRSQPDAARFNISRQVWEPLPPLPAGRSSHDAAVIGDTLYVVGGWTLNGSAGDSKWHTTALAMDLKADQPEWKTIATPPFQRRALALAAWQGKLYCIGGMREKGGMSTEVNIYDPASNSWSTGPELIGSGMEGFGSSAFASQGALYVTTISGSVQRLAGDGTEWEYVGQLLRPRFFHRLLPWQEELVIVGGASMMTGKTPDLEVLPVGADKTTANR